MGLFSTRTFECQLCGKNVNKEYFDDTYKLCYYCLMKMNNDIERLQRSIAKFQELANSSKNADEKIIYLTSILDDLYEYKVKYDDNGIEDGLSADVKDLIDTVIEHIANAKLEKY